ncbi:helix-turn-helix domain-containing protein [Paenibacillus albidus]|uniref:helix-turn-helix domain-containing protein n=1 Tax=Paenibacillus albidus TaxID=2041023 RepID=UPI00166C335B
MALRHGKCLLRNIRTSAGMTQEDLSELLLTEVGLAVSVKTISKYENNHQIMPSLVLRGICIVLGCSESQVYQWPK